MGFEINKAFNDVIKAALKATLQDKADYLIYIDEFDIYGFVRGQRGKLVIPCKKVRYLGWTEYSVEYDIPRARYFEFEKPLTVEELHML